MTDNRKPLFTALAHIELDGERKKLSLKSPAHWRQQVAGLMPGKKYGLTVEEYKASRSRQQLAYYWVLLGYLAKETGHTPEELHDAIMRQKFGTKHVRVGHIEQDVRQSVSDSARFPTSDMVELIQETLDLCGQLGVHVPSREELGYLPS